MPLCWQAFPHIYPPFHRHYSWSMPLPLHFATNTVAYRTPIFLSRVTRHRYSTHTTFTAQPCPCACCLWNTRATRVAGISPWPTTTSLSTCALPHYDDRLGDALNVLVGRNWARCGGDGAVLTAYERLWFSSGTMPPPT